MRRKIPAFAASVLALAIAASFAHAGQGGHRHDSAAGGHAPVREQAHGKPGDTKKVSRTVIVEMTDAMRFNPSELSIKQGETIRFIVKNTGKLEHELVLGTLDELKKHGELMRKHPRAAPEAHDMHDGPSAARAQPAAQKELVWQFTRPGEFHFACLIPGHFEAGMAGKIRVRKS